MIYFLNLISSILIIWLFIELVTAKVGYEDETGFHYGRGPASTTANGDGEQNSINPAQYLKDKNEIQF